MCRCGLAGCVDREGRMKTADDTDLPVVIEFFDKPAKVKVLLE